jgi:hypothetical protein
MLTAELDAKADFAAFFAEGWGIGATDPERFFAHFGDRMTPDALMSQPLAPSRRGPAGLRLLFTPLFEVLPDLRGELVRWGPTDDGVIAELELRSPSTGVRWTTVDVIELRDGLIAARHAHFDPLPLIAGLLKRPLASAKLVPSLLRR